MATLEFLPVTAEEVPIEKDFTIGDSTYSWLFKYNETFDFYSLEIINEGGVTVYTTKLTYGSDIVNAVVDGLRISRIVVPFNILELTQEIALQNQRVSKDSLGRTVFLLLGLNRE